VWRLTSEALQGAGSVLSYHASLLMVDEPALLGHAGSDAGAQQSGPAASSSGPTPGAVATAKQDNSRRRQHQQHAQLQHHQSGRGQHEQGLQQQYQTLLARSSIEIAAASAAVVAASEDAHHHAAAAAAAAATVAYSWAKEPEAAVYTAEDTADSSAPAGASSSSNTRSKHSSADSINSLVGSDAIADAAAEYSKRFTHEHPQEQQDGSASTEPWLSEQLLLDLAEQKQQLGVDLTPSNGTRVDAWVSATAAVISGLFSRHGSMTEPGIRPHVSEDGSLADNMTPTTGLGSGALQAAAGRRSLDAASSLYFTEELEDKAFLQMMRVLSQSKGTSPTKPPAAADASAKLSGSFAQQPSAAAAPAGVTDGPASERKGLPHSKSAGSALSALSVAGSSTAPEDWSHAVSQQQDPAGSSSMGVDVQGAGNIQSGSAPAQASMPSTAFSIESSRTKPVLRDANSIPQKQHSSRPSRLGAPSLLATVEQQAPGSISTRQTLGARAWSFLTQGFWRAPQVHPVTPEPSRLGKQSPAAVKQAWQETQHKQKQQPPGDSMQHTGTGSLPPLLPPPITSAQLQPLIGRAKAVLASARVEPWWLRPKGCQHFDAYACMKLLDDIELLLVR
jgi:hypothetical protein